VTTPPSFRFSFAGLVAVLAGIAGLVLLTIAVVRFVGLVGDAVEGTTTSSVAISSTNVAATSVAEPSAVAIDTPSVTVTDDSDTISITVPAAWSEVSGSGWVVDGREQGPAIVAAPNVDDWYSTWGTPGVFVGVSTTDFAPEMGDFSDVCAMGKTDDRSAGILFGTVQSWTDCGTEGSNFYVFVGGPSDASYAVLVQLVSIDGTGLGSLEKVLTTFSYER